MIKQNTKFSEYWPRLSGMTPKQTLNKLSINSILSNKTVVFCYFVAFKSYTLYKNTFEREKGYIKP